jgi:type I restriction enzyme S subunit
MTRTRIKPITEEDQNTIISDEWPEGWISAQIGEVSDVIGGGTPESSDPSNFAENGHPWVTPADLSGFQETYIGKGQRSLSDKGLRTCSARLMPKGTVLMSSRAPIGYLAIAANAVATNQGFKSFICSEGVVPEYCYYWLRLIRPHLESMGSGSTFLEISGSRAREIPIILAPMPEQQRIVAKVEKLLPHVNASHDHFAKVVKILKAFRRSILAAACSGRLTEDWRISHDLQRPELPTVRDLDLSDLPDSWVWTAIEHVAEIQGGIQKQPKRVPRRNAFPYLRVANVHRDRLDLSEIKEMELFEGELAVYRLEKGDLLIVEGNGSIDQIGRSALWTGEIKNCVHQNHIIRVRAKKCSAEYLNIYLNSPIGIDRVTDAAVTTAGLYSLSTKKIATLPAPIPPMPEQIEIVRRVEALFALADSIDKGVQAATKRANKLTQAILGKAFRGELVATEAELARREGRDYEPASVLLKRIAEREVSKMYKIPRTTPRARTSERK